MVEALRGRWSLRELLAAVGMAKSSYEYAKGALARGEGPERAAAREAVRAAFEESGGTYGYRRIYAQVNLSCIFISDMQCPKINDRA